MPLYIGKKYQWATTPVQSIFRLAGSDEDALTYALGYLLAHEGVLCGNLLKLLRIRNRRGLKDGYFVHLQEVTDKGFGRRDIVIEYGKTRIVLEAKIGTALPTVDQITKYATESTLWNQFDNGWVVALTQIELAEDTQKKIGSKLPNGIRFKNVQRHEVIEIVLNYKPSDGSEVTRYLFNEFNRFIRGDYDMGYHDAEIHIQDVNPLNANIFKCGWMCVTSLKDRKAPLYFAPYFTKQGENTGISMMSRVRNSEVVMLASTENMGVNPPSEEHRERWEHGFKMLRDRGKKEGFAFGETRVFYFDRPMTIAKTPITKKSFNATNPSKQIPTMISKGFSLRFDELLPRCGIGEH